MKTRNRKEEKAKYYQLNKEKIREGHALWYSKNKEKVSTDRKKNYSPTVRRRRGLKELYNISFLDYQWRLLKQNFQCAICNKRVENDVLHVDHQHDTKVIRGLLCGQCNKGLGLFRDNIYNLKNAIKYLMRG